MGKKARIMDRETRNTEINEKALSAEGRDRLGGLGRGEMGWTSEGLGARVGRR